MGDLTKAQREALAGVDRFGCVSAHVTTIRSLKKLGFVVASSPWCVPWRAEITEAGRRALSAPKKRAAKGRKA